MKWDQKKISEWAESQFGFHPALPIAVRGNKEMAELISSIMNNIPAEDIAEECADVCIFLMQICNRMGHDLLEKIDEKMDINEKRQWTLADDGSHQHIKEEKPFLVIKGHIINKGEKACNVCGETNHKEECVGF